MIVDFANFECSGSIVDHELTNHAFNIIPSIFVIET